MAAPTLLRDGAPPLPPDLPAYVLELTWQGDRVTGRGTVTVPNPGDAPLGDLSFLLHGNDGPRASTRVTKVDVPGRTVAVDADVRELLLHVTPPIEAHGRADVVFEWEVALAAQPPGNDDLLMQGLAQLGGHGGDYGLQATAAASPCSRAATRCSRRASTARSRRGWSAPTRRSATPRGTGPRGGTSRSCTRPGGRW
jgi:hypothetical protein